MAKDPYSVLGLSPGASNGDIRTAYRRLAKTWHPDRNPGDAKAEEKFKEISNAFALLGDKEKRQAFDRGEIDADGNPLMGGFGGGRPGGGFPGGGSGGGFEDIFADLFNRQNGGFGGGRRAPQRGRDMRFRITIGFIEAAKGATRRVSMPDGRAVDVTIPEGLRHGQSLRLKGKGGAGVNGGPMGDLYVEVDVAAHPYFRLEKGLIHLDVPITLREAVLGETITIPTIHGDVSIKIPKGASSGTSLRVKGKGIFNPKTKQRGDQIVKLHIKLPDKPDPTLEDFVKGWRSDEDKDIRQKFRH